MTAFINHFVFEFRTGVRDKTQLLMNYLLPLGFYVMMGMVMVEINPGFREVLLPSMVIFAVLASTLLGIPDPLVNAREKGVFRSYKINGIPAFNILVIPVLTTMLHMLLLAIVISATADSVFGIKPEWMAQVFIDKCIYCAQGFKTLAPEYTGPLNFPLFAGPNSVTNWWNFVLVFFATAFASAGLSVLIGVASPSSRITVLWSQAMFLPSMLIGGLMMPYSVLPEGAQLISRMLPSSHMMNAFTTLAMGKAGTFDAWASVGILFAGGALAMGLAWYLFSWDSASGSRRGRSLMGFLAMTPYVIGAFIL